jgi:toxin ParE1/3/4
MKVVYTAEALRDLDEILAYFAKHYPTIILPFQQRLRAVERRIARWPKSAPEVEQRPGVRCVSFIQYPYKIFYQITQEWIEVLHVYHAARHQPPNS